jgi:HemY protein
MNRLLYILLISAITIAGFTMFKQNDIGHISFQFAGNSFETNFIVFTAALLTGLFALLLFFKAIIAIKDTSLYIAHLRQNRLKEKARLSLSQGLIEYADGQFEQSEKTLIQPIKYSDNLLPVYLNAARAAQQLGAHDRRDDYLRKAHEAMPEADVAIQLTKAELQLAHNQNEQALATLAQLYELKPQHNYVLTLLTNTYLHLQDWDKLSSILPQLKKYGSFSDESFLSFETDVCKGQLSNLGKTSDVKALTDFWSNTAKHLKASVDIVEYYVKQLIQIGATSEAESVLRQFLTKHWQDSTIILYSELDVLVDNKQLETVESWLEDHQQNSFLLLVLGKMCIARSLWGKARSYLEASVSITPMPETYLILARLLEENMNAADEAQKFYRKGLHLLTGDYHEDIILHDKQNLLQESPQLKIVKS